MAYHGGWGGVPQDATCDCGRPENVVVDHAAGDMICTDCGVVIESHLMDERPEWHGPGEDGARPDGRRAGPAGGLLPGLASTTLDRLPAKLHKYVTAEERAPGERVALDGFRAIDQLAAELRLTGTVVETAKEVMRDACLKNARLGTMAVLAASCVYYACKIAGVSRRKREIAGMCRVSETDLNAVNKALKVALTGRPYHASMYSSVRPADLIFRAVDRLDMLPEDRRRVKRRAMDLDRAVQASGALEGRTPGGICCALVFAAMKLEGLTPSKKAVTATCQVSCVTLNKAVKALQAAGVPGF